MVPLWPVQAAMASAKRPDKRLLQPITHVYTSGRPPWFDVHGELRDAYLIGIAGGWLLFFMK